MKFVYFAFAICVLLVSKETAYTGVDFYSGSGSPSTFTFGSGGPPWFPVAGTAAALIPDTSAANNVKLDGSEGSGSSTGFELRMSSASRGFGQGLYGVIDTATYTLNGTGTGYVTTDTTPDMANASAVVNAWNGTDTAFNYSFTSDNYFLWHANTTGTSGNLIGLGWALYDCDPTSPGSDTTDKFIIKEWAYNLAGQAGDATIRVGDTDDGSSNNNGGGGGQVPEPTGLAIFALASLGLASARRRRS